MKSKLSSRVRLNGHVSRTGLCPTSVRLTKNLLIRIAGSNVTNSLNIQTRGSTFEFFLDRIGRATKKKWSNRWAPRKNRIGRPHEKIGSDRFFRSDPIVPTPDSNCLVNTHQCDLLTETCCIILCHIRTLLYIEYVYSKFSIHEKICPGFCRFLYQKMRSGGNCRN